MSLRDRVLQGVKLSGVLVGRRKDFNFIQGANVTLTVADDSANNEIDITIAAAGGGGGSQHTIKDEGTPLTARSGLNFIGSMVAVTDDAINDETEVTLTDPVPAHVALADPHTQYQKESEKDAANGYCGLDGSALIPDARIPAGITRDTELSAHEADTTSIHGITNTADIVLDTIVDAKGDIIAATAADTLARLAVGANDRVLVADSGQSTGLKWDARVFSRGGTYIDTAGITAAINIIVWRAPFACTVTAVKGYRVGGTGATINARKNGTDNHLASAVSLSSADTWTDGGSVQNTAYSAGDKMEIMIVSVTGSPTQIAVQIDLTRP